MRYRRIRKRGEQLRTLQRVIINSGIDHVIIRDTHNDYRIVNVKKWIDDDETLTGSVGY